MFFDIATNSNEPLVDSHPDFRLIATHPDNHLDALFPTLHNRFNVAYLDKKLEDLPRVHWD
jgi:hypothetical protein